MKPGDIFCGCLVVWVIGDTGQVLKDGRLVDIVRTSPDERLYPDGVWRFVMPERGRIDQVMDFINAGVITQAQACEMLKGHP